MMTKLAILLFLFSALVGHADILDDIKANIPARVVPWSPGVKGGITNYPVQHSVTDYGAVGDGTTECYAAFTNGIARTTNGGALYIPNGTYLISTNITIPWTNHIVLRGQSRTNTILKSSGGNLAAHIVVNGDFSRNVTSVTSATAGQSNIVVGSASGISAGEYFVILQTNDTAVVFGSLTTNNTPWQGQMFQITNVSGTTLTADRPVYWTNYTTALKAAGAGFDTCASYLGFEDFTLLANNATPDYGIRFLVAANCWVKNVLITNVAHQHIDTWWVYRLEIRDSRFENHSTYDSNARYAVALARNATDCLVENNIMLGHNLALTVQQGANGNVIGYNFTENGFGNSFPSDNGTKGGMNSHGDNAHYNLFEGNVTPWIQWDNFWGEDNRETAFRNWMTRQSFYNTTGSISLQGTAGLFVDSTNYHMTAVGNIIGSPRDSGDSDPGIELDWDRRNSVQNHDVMLTNTFFNHYNYEFRNGSITSSNGYSGVLPGSFYLTSKPSWFGNLAWPAIGPDVNTNNTITNSAVIPAQARFLGQNYTTIFVTNSARSTRLRGWRGF